MCEMCRAGKEREAALMHSLLSSASDLREDLFVPKHLGLGLWDFLPSGSHTQSSHITPRCLTLQQNLLTAALGAPSWRIFSSPSTSQQLPGCWGSSKETTLILCAVSHRWEFSSSPACGAAAAQNSPLPADGSPTTSSSHSSSPSLSCTYRDGKRRITQHKIPAQNSSTATNRVHLRVHSELSFRTTPTHHLLSLHSILQRVQQGLFKQG